MLTADLAQSALNFGPRFIGEITLMTAVAVLLGYGVYRILPAAANPKLLGSVVPFLALGTLAYLGSIPAAVAVVLFVVIALGAISLGLS
jgi:hypothetical protein